MTLIYRLSSSRYLANSGAGAATFGGRWNKIGTPVIYAAESRSLAALEILVHYDVIPQNFVVAEIQIPDDVEISTVSVDVLPDGWNAETISSATQEVGDRWASERRTAVLSVPSSVIPLERNVRYQLTPLRVEKLTFSAPLPFRFDSRLK